MPCINYDRILPLNYKTGIVLKAGLSSYARLFLTTEASLITGRMKNFFEIGAGWGGKDILGIYGRLGYRYIGVKGFMFKGGILIVKNVPVFPSIGLGYSF